MAAPKAAPSFFLKKVAAQPASGSQFLTDAERAVDADEDQDMSEAEKPTKDPSILHQIISLQSFDGSWDLKPLLELIGLASTPKANRPSSVRNDEPLDVKIWATILAIRYLEDKLAHEEEAWELLVAKAHHWLKGVVDNGVHMSEEWNRIAMVLMDEI